jgi:hypothetical protein
LQRLQNKALRTIGNFPRRSTIRDLHVAIVIPFVYDYIIKLCGQQAEVIQNHDNENVRNIGQGEANHRKYNNSVVFSPLANYTDRAIAAGQRS